MGAIDKGSKNTLIVDQIENIGGHYAKTLRLWNQKFQQNFDARIKPALLQEHDNMTSADTELFRRKWEVRGRMSIRGRGQPADKPSIVLFQLFRSWFQHQDSG